MFTMRETQPESSRPRRCLVIGVMLVATTQNLSFEDEASRIPSAGNGSAAIPRNRSQCLHQIRGAALADIQARYSLRPLGAS
jgi:hypothetical protein